MNKSLIKYQKYKLKNQFGGLICHPTINSEHTDKVKKYFLYDGNYDIGFTKEYNDGRIVVTRELNQFNYPIKLGEGNFGKVYKAIGHIFHKNKTNKISLALKEMIAPNELQHNIICSEILSIFELNHPNILKYYGYHEKEGTNSILLLMEYIEGKDLLFRIKNGHLNLNEKISVALDTLEGLTYLHSKNVFHRDIKPDNIMIVKNKSGIKTKYIDFNLSCKKNLSCESSQLGLGTPDYLSPETAKNLWGPKEERKKDSNMFMYNDLWALGVTLYILFANKYLFQAPSVENLSHQLMSINQEYINDKITRNIPDVIDDQTILSNYQHIRNNIISLLKVNPLERKIIQKVERQLHME